MEIHTRLAVEGFSPSSELAAMEVGDAGAVASMIGRCRDRRADGTAVLGMLLDHHPRLTAQSLEQIAGDAATRFDLLAVRVLHRSGLIRPGAAIVFAAAAATHRRAAIEAVDYMMDRLKTEALFWKREDAVDGSRWIEPTDADRAAAARWSD